MNMSTASIRIVTRLIIGAALLVLVAQGLRLLVRDRVRAHAIQVIAL